MTAALMLGSLAIGFVAAVIGAGAVHGNGRGGHDRCRACAHSWGDDG